MLIDPEERKPIVIHTRKGRNVGCEPPRLAMSPEEVRKAEREYETVHKTRLGLAAYLRRPPSSAYNCHGLTFAMRRAWLNLDSDRLQEIITDDGYVTVSERDVKPGDIAVYYYDDEPEHTAVVVWCEPDTAVACPWVVSKLGSGPEVIHRYNQSPYSNKKVLFYREGSP